MANVKAKYYIRWRYVQANYTLYKSPTHANTRGRIWRGLDAWCSILRNDYGCNIWHQHVTSGKYIPVSVGREQLYIGNGYYGTGMYSKGRVWLLSFVSGNDPFANPKTLGLVTFHEFTHYFDYDSKPSSDKHGHSIDPKDYFHAYGGGGVTTSLGFVRSLGGIIPGWKPKAKIEELPDIGHIFQCGGGIKLDGTK